MLERWDGPCILRGPFLSCGVEICFGDGAVSMIRITLLAKTMEGLDAVDPEMTVDIVDVTQLRQAVLHKVITNFSGKTVIQLPAPDGFPTWQVNVTFSRFDAGNGFFFQPQGNANPSHTFLVARLPGAWTPEFTELAELPAARFGPFKQVVAVSDSVDIKNGP